MLDPGEDGLAIVRSDGKVLVSGLCFDVGDGDEVLEMSMGSYREVSGETRWRGATLGDPDGDDPTWVYPLLDPSGETLGTVAITGAARGLVVQVRGDGNRLRWRAACTGEDAFAGLGQHAMDVNHVGQAFPLWVSEPGVGKSESESPPADWYLTGTRHASSFPDPFLVRPEPMGLIAETDARVELDLCTGDAWTVEAWTDALEFVVLDAEAPIDLVRQRATRYGPVAVPPDWAYAPWNDAVGGEARVREVAATLREAGAPSSVIWTEDWKGAELTAWGYHLLPEWELDPTLYPDAPGLDAELEAQGFKWLAYFSPFLVEGSRAWEEAADHAIRTATGEPYTFTGVTFEPTSVLDLGASDARAWAADKMHAVLDLGFDGWMADYAEWLPPDAVLTDRDPMEDHNAYPLDWQSLNAEVVADRDATFFTRSGWRATPALSPVGWAGDQRTSFDADDGLPSVIPMGIGAGMSGQSWYGSDIAGYQSLGNDPSTKELWFRWCSLGAFSPVMRTHHGAFKDENWQFDSDAETLAHYARYAREHARLYPYLRALGALAEADGTPMILAPFLVFPEEDWGRLDAWMLGPYLFVAPVVEAGASTRWVDLPDAVTWYDWWTGEVAVDGTVDSPVDHIPVYAPAGAIVPLFAEPPDTFVDGPLEGLRTHHDVDDARIVRVYAGLDGALEEADGTRYRSTGKATGPGTVSGSFATGTLSVNGVTVTIDGPVERAYTVELYAP